jgi:hypothetical protein
MFDKQPCRGFDVFVAVRIGIKIFGGAEHAASRRSNCRAIGGGFVTAMMALNRCSRPPSFWT